MAGIKLTAAQKKEIFRRAVFDGECAAQLAEEYGVSRREIERVTHDRKRIEGERDTLEAMRELAKLRVMVSADRAVQKQLELMDRQVPENMLYINQKAAADIMNRAGIKQEKRDVGKVRVVFEKGNVTFNMPEERTRSDGQDEHDEDD